MKDQGISDFCINCTYKRFAANMRNAEARDNQMREEGAKAIRECRKILGDYVIYKKCPFDGDCARCFLCDNAGGCIVTSDEDIRKEIREAAACEREDVIDKIISSLFDSPLTDNGVESMKRMGEIIESLRSEVNK